MRSTILLATCCASLVAAFAPTTLLRPPTSNFRLASSTETEDASTSTEQTTTAVSSMIDPKEAVKIFGRLAEKYIMLDSSGGSCCYSACTDCEYRLPGGGYIMADQSAARPKWIPCYESRSANDKEEHCTKWSTQLFVNGPAVTKEEFVERLAQQLDYAPPLGGPYVGASAAGMEDPTAAEYFFDVLADGKSKLTKHKMSVRLQQLAEGEEGLIWPAFQRAMGLA